ncbi:TPA: hypothetical protein ACNIEI_001715 [Pseudomonas aeruginosa]
MSKELNKAPVGQAGGDERAAFELFVRKHCGMPAHIAVNWDAKFTNDAWAGWQARAALAQPSPKCSTCGGTGMVDDGEIDCYSDGTPFENGPVKCVKDCPACKAQPSPAQAEQHWPKLEKPAQVGAICFSAGVSSRLVVEAAQRLYEFESTPEKEAERIERLQAFREQLDPLNLAPHAEAFNEAPDEALRPEQAEAERSALWAVHAQGPDELYAAFSREDAEKHAAELNALPMPEGIAVGAVVVPSPWPAVQHWQYLAEQEQDHKNEIAGRLRQHERIGEALRAEIAEWQEAAGRSRSDVVAYIAERAKLLEERDAAQARVAGLEAELETERMRLAACGTAALGYFDGCADAYKSASLSDVLQLRADCDSALARVAELEACGAPALLAAADYFAERAKGPSPGWVTLSAVAKELRVRADKAPVAQAQHSVPEGWKLVPIEPTQAQLSAGQTAWLADPMRRSTTLYRAMLAAAPQPVAEGE